VPSALVVRAGALGDLLLLRRAIFALHRAGHAVSLLAPAASGAALLGPGPADARRLLDWERADMAALVSEGGVARGALHDDLAGHDLALAYTRDAALVRNLGALVPRVAAHDPAPPAGARAARWLAAPVTALGIPADAAPPPCAATPGEAEAAHRLCDRLPRSFLAIHAGSGSPRKSWPAARFVALLEALAPDRWLLVCGPADADASAALRRRPGAVVAEGLPARVLGAALGRAGLFVGNDSGVSHLAAAWGAPTIALFGPTDAATWAPDGPCVRVVRSSDGTMEGIAVEAVVKAAGGLRSGVRARPSG